MTSEKGCRKDKNQNIQVFVRLRPLNQRERYIKSLGVIEVLHNREVVVRQSHTKKFTFDRAFGPHAKQVEVYQEVVSPLIEEVLAGYNCTVFAYGQTGTGKTHTMVGENTSDNTNWQNDPMAGIIPRALSQLFDELRISATEHTVRVSYLELYNEELFDLLSSSSEDNSKLRIYEDVTRKGSNIVNGLEEITVSNKNEVYKIMAQGQERKKVASTLMNAQSSRSHTVFTIVVHMKENSPEGEELVKIGKLNLVDLAGSENISKAGSDNPAKKERARECVNINQSLLTLGRVITALVEKHPHIPYRESKLTRILQESLGGRTKTSIIATISPGHKDLEETMSTLEYANRAKNIQNKPEVNQKMTKKAILRQYAEEIDRLKKDLQAARDKNGVFLSVETYTELTLQQEEQRKEIQELLLKRRALEEDRDKMENVFASLNQTLEARAKQLDAARGKLSTTRTLLTNTNNILRSTQLEAEERGHLVEQHQATETALGQRARELLAVADVATVHVRCLHDTVDKRRNVESTNLQVTRSYRDQSSEHRAHLTAGVAHFSHYLLENLNALHSDLENVTSAIMESLQGNRTTMDQLVQSWVQLMEEIKSIAFESQRRVTSNADSQRSLVKVSIDRRQGSVQAAFATLLQSVASCVQAAQTHNLPESVANLANQWLESARGRIEALQRTHSEYSTKLTESEAARAEHAREHTAARRAHIDTCVQQINQILAEIEEEKSEVECRVAQQAAEMESERARVAARLLAWQDDERRRLEERLRAYVDTETAALETRLGLENERLESERRRVEARLARRAAAMRAQLAACAAEAEQAARGEAGGEACSLRAHNATASYSDQFQHDAAAISSEMEAMAASVVEEARRVHADLLSTLLQANEQIQRDTEAAATQARAADDHFLAETEAAHTNSIQDYQSSIDSVLAVIEAKNSCTMSTVAGLSASTEAVVSRARQHTARHAARVQDVTSLGASFEAQLREAVERHAELEARYLADEYKVYSPTGATPQRGEFRYARALPATSPHHRILERFRALRAATRADDDECMVVDSDSESRQTSDGESTFSEESAVFAAPSPPGPAAAPAPHNTLGIMKCTSESDIYNIKRKQEQQGKENADHSMTNGGYKKPSKLRAPSSHKKPLVERNGPN